MIIANNNQVFAVIINVILMDRRCVVVITTFKAKQTRGRFIAEEGSKYIYIAFFTIVVVRFF